MSENEEIPAESIEQSKTIRQGRRRFWADLLGEVWSVSEEIRGIVQQPLSDIGRLADSVLEEMVPVWMEDAPLEIRQDGIYRKGPDEKITCKYSFTPLEKMIVDQYGCGRNLETIADHVAEALYMEKRQAFEATKNLFIQLCRRGWCHPAASHVLEKGE
jgi:hypothetical protein